MPDYTLGHPDHEGGVFRDLGFSETEAKSKLIRADLMIHLNRYIRQNKLKQVEAAERLGVSQPRISQLMNGQINAFTIDSLVEMLTRAGLYVLLKVTQTEAQRI